MSGRLATAVASSMQFSSFGEMLRTLRKQVKLTQYELGLAANYSEGQISRLEKNLRAPNMSVVKTCFIPALQLDDESETAQQLLRLAVHAQHRGFSQNSQRPLEKISRKAPVRQRANLPVRLTSFVGRVEEIAALQQSLRNNRLVTITGMGGCGKTSLALETARTLCAGERGSKRTFGDGVWLVELATVSDAALLVRTVALALGVSENETEPLATTLLRALHPQVLLLVLDNCEHLLDDVAQLIQSLLQACPNLHVLATSREPLSIPGEVRFPLPPLALPAAPQLPTLDELTRVEAVRLFVERARTAWPGFALTAQNAQAVVTLCQRLDGLPLAIELAAAHVRSLRVEEIVARLPDCFQLLTDGDRTAPTRHQTLHGLIDWSYNRLNANERCLFRQLSIFANGFTLAAVEGIADCFAGEKFVVLHCLSSLVAKSLVVEQRTLGDITRYALLETVREYARDKLEAAHEAPSTGRRHLAYYLQLAETVEPKLKGADQALWLQQMDHAQENFRLALVYALTHAPEPGLHLLLALQHFWWVRGHWCEWAEWVAKLMAAPGMPPRTQAGARALSLLALNTKDFQAASSLLAQSLALCQELGDKRGLALSLYCHGDRIWWENHTQAKAYFEQSFTLFREIGDKWHMAYLLRELGELAQVRYAAHNEARSLLSLSLELYRELADQRGIADALTHLADLAFEQGDLVAAQRYAQEGLTLAEQIGFKAGMYWGLLSLGEAAWGHQHFDEAQRWFAQAFLVAQGLGDAIECVIAQYWLATTLQAQQAYAHAEKLHHENLRTSREHHYHWGIGLSFYGLGEVARAQQQGQPAALYLLDALVALAQIDYHWGMVRVFHALAYLAVPSADALCLFGVADALAATTATNLYPHEQREIDEAMATLRTSLDEQTFATAWAAGQTMTAADALQFALVWVSADQG